MVHTSHTVRRKGAKAAIAAGVTDSVVLCTPLSGPVSQTYAVPIGVATSVCYTVVAVKCGCPKAAICAAVITATDPSLANLSSPPVITDALPATELVGVLRTRVTLSARRSPTRAAPCMTGATIHITLIPLPVLIALTFRPSPMRVDNTGVTVALIWTVAGAAVRRTGTDVS
jgi:hypothetical protein